MVNNNIITKTLDHPWINHNHAGKAAFLIGGALVGLCAAQILNRQQEQTPDPLQAAAQQRIETQKAEDKQAAIHKLQDLQTAFRLNLINMHEQQVASQREISNSVLQPLRRQVDEAQGPNQRIQFSQNLQDVQAQEDQKAQKLEVKHARNLQMQNARDQKALQDLQAKTPLLTQTDITLGAVAVVGLIGASVLHDKVKYQMITSLSTKHPTITSGIALTSASALATFGLKKAEWTHLVAGAAMTGLTMATIHRTADTSDPKLLAAMAVGSVAVGGFATGAWRETSTTTKMATVSILGVFAAASVFAAKALNAAK